MARGYSSLAPVMNDIPNTHDVLRTLQWAGLELACDDDSDSARSKLTFTRKEGGKPVRFLCAVSGGLDSMVLLHLFKKARLPVRAIHVDHAANPESSKWADWVGSQAQAMDVPVVIHRLANTLGEGSLEELWRDARMALFRQELQDDEILVTAHHQDDQIETFLLQLFRGAGPTGLQGMPLRHCLAQSQLHIRPLLFFTRSSLEAYARSCDVAFLNDPSNADTRFDRNFLRKNILPQLKERWPSVSGAVARSSELIAEAVELNETLAAQDGHILQDDGSLDWASLAAMDAVRQANVVRYWLKQSGLRMPNRRRLAEALRQWNEAADDRLPVLELESGTVQKYRSRLVYQPSKSAHFDQWGGELELGGWLTLPDAEGSIGLVTEQARIGDRQSADLLREQVAGRTLSVRYRQNGEKLRRAAGHHQKLKHWFQQNDVPPVQRSRLPLVFLGSELIAIATIWVDARFRVGAEQRATQKSCRLIWRI